MIRCLIITVCTLLPLLLHAQEEDLEPILPNELTIGIGAGFPLEQDPLNIAGEPGVPSAFAINLGFRRYLEVHYAIGVRLHGYFSTLTGYTINDESNVTSDAEFDLSVLNLSFEGLMLFSTGKIRPYGFLMVGFATGTLSHDKLDDLSFNGVSGGGGLGLQFELSENVALAFEAWARSELPSGKGNRSPTRLAISSIHRQSRPSYLR